MRIYHSAVSGQWGYHAPMGGSLVRELHGNDMTPPDQKPNPDTGGFAPAVRPLCAKEPSISSAPAPVPRKPALRINHLRTPCPRCVPAPHRETPAHTPSFARRGKGPPPGISFQRVMQIAVFGPGRSASRSDPVATTQPHWPKFSYDLPRVPYLEERHTALHNLSACPNGAT